MRKYFIIFFVFLWTSSTAQKYERSEVVKLTAHKWGIELIPTSLISNLRSLSASVWLQTNDRNFISFDVGYGRNFLAPRKIFRNEEITGPEYRNLILEIDYNHIWNNHKFQDLYYSIGPIYQKAEWDIRKNYFYNRNTRILTLHKGAQFNLKAFGISTSVGMRNKIDQFTIDFRLGIKSLFQDGFFENVEDRFIVKQFVPSKLMFYQKAGEKLVFRPFFSLRFGMAF